MLKDNNVRIDLRYPGTANIVGYESNGKRFETACFTFPSYRENIISISVASGCIVQCGFCEVGKQGLGKNLTVDEMVSQVIVSYSIMGQCDWVDLSKPLKVAFNRGGEPLLNENVYGALEILASTEFSDKYLKYGLNALEIVTVMPDTLVSDRLIEKIAGFKFDENFYMQVSMHTSDEQVRRSVIPYDHLKGFEDIAKVGELMHKSTGKKTTLAFHLMETMPVSARDIRKLFNPTYFRVRFAYYSPVSEYARKHFPRSKRERIDSLVRQFIAEGFDAYPSLISPAEHEVNTHPGAALSLFADLER